MSHLGGIMPRDLRALRWVALVTVLMTGAAQAGGYDTGERDWDFLFQQGKGGVEAEVRFLVPQRKLNNVVGTGALNLGITTATVNETEPFIIKRMSGTMRLADRALCMASYREPWAGHASYGSTWAGVGAVIAQHFSSVDLGLTCSVYMPLGIGNLHMLGGLSHQSIKYELMQGFFGIGTARTLVEDDGFGWRAGVAYEIPQYAMLFSLIYNSETDYDMTGTWTTPIGTTPVFGSITMPRSVEFKARSGIAPGWLAFASIKWTDWSVADNMPLCPVGVPACTMAGAVSALTLLWDDTWTVTAGLAHQFSQAFSMAGYVTFDEGASQGFTSQTDTWVAGLTGVLTPIPGVVFKLGGTVGVLTGGTLSTAVLPGGIANPVGYTATFGDDLVYSLNASVAGHF